MNLTALLLAAAIQGQGNQSRIAFTWNYSYVGIPSCATAYPQTNCILRFELGENGQAFGFIPSTSETSYLYTLAPLPSPGTHTYSLVAVAQWTGNKTIASAPATVSIKCPNSKKCQVVVTRGGPK